MRIDIISAVPSLMESFFGHSIIKRSIDKQLLELNIIDLRSYGLNNYNQIDDYQYGGGAGMVLMVEPLFNCIQDLMTKVKYDEIIYLTPDGIPYKQKTANSLSLKKSLLLIAGHYKGIDQRIRDHFVTMEISVGDYVLSGGELAAAIMADTIGRLIPGVLNDETSALEDSFQDGLLAPPVYSRPADFNGWLVPEILLSGHEEKISEWRLNQSIEKTRLRRPDLLDENL
ncbi:MAG TPA: tRNA (guanosine(37)-N1)-methyltransferase TrmD [Saprospirales bacterium]|nr:tRNA (guanosine(37)-N1)-methyltransferase TrmD [Saprospirales bacterium]HRQ30769.1 tRNA (guanosine(37)-N1)-methyltransferase TrmD [Saprospiraceae bacterium]